MTVGNNIRTARKAAGLTQAQLAEKSGVAAISIHQYEAGKRRPQLKQLLAISSALNMEWTDLVPEEEQSDSVITHIKEKLKGSGPLHKMSDSEAQKAGFLQFHSDDDRIAHFYSLLNIDGKLIASKYFFQHLNEETKSIVADYVQHLSEIPQYQRQSDPQSPPPSPEGTDTTPTEKPPESP